MPANIEADSPRTALVYGTALDTDSVPMANATVRLRPADYLAEASPRGLTKRTAAIKELTTDEFGQFFMDSIEPGIYVIEITTRSGALYIDGTLIDSFTTPAPIQFYPELDRPLSFGCQIMLNRKYGKAFLCADIDEIRLSRTVRSRSWIRPAYENARPGSRIVEIR